MRWKTQPICWYAIGIPPPANALLAAGRAGSSPRTNCRSVGTGKAVFSRQELKAWTGRAFAVTCSGLRRVMQAECAISTKIVRQYDIQRYRGGALKRGENQAESPWPTFSEIGRRGLFAAGFPTGDSTSSSGRNRGMRQSSAPLGKWCL